MTFRALVLVSCPLCVWPLLYFCQRYCFYCNLQTIRIERELIKHTFLQRFLHYVNIICINITKRDPNNLIIFFFSLGMCFKDNLFFCVENGIYQELGDSLLPGFYKWLYSSSRNAFQKSPRSTVVTEGQMVAVCGVRAPRIS